MGDWETILVVVIVTFLVPCPPVTAACRQSWAGNVFGYEFNFCAGFLFNLMSKSNSAEWWAAEQLGSRGGGSFNSSAWVVTTIRHTITIIINTIHQGVIMGDLGSIL